MSYITYVCKCVLDKGKRSNDFDFDGERYISIRDFEICIFYCQVEVPELSDYFFGITDGLLTVYDGDRFFVLAVNVY